MLKLTQFIGTKSLLAIDLVSTHTHQTRWIRTRKPPWVPRAKNKQFRIPPLHVQDPTIKSYMTPIWLVSRIDIYHRSIDLKGCFFKVGIQDQHEIDLSTI